MSSFTHYRWDDDTSRVLSISDDGTVIDSRPYTAAEIAERELARRMKTLSEQLAAGIQIITTARDAAQADIATADSLRGQADALATVVQDRITAVAAFVPGATYRASDLVAIRSEVLSILDRQKTVIEALREMYQYRKAVDVNAVETDEALLWLARLVSGVLD